MDGAVAVDPSRTRGLERDKLEVAKLSVLELACLLVVTRFSNASGFRCVVLLNNHQDGHESMPCLVAPRFLCRQFENEANAKFHYDTTGQEGVASRETRLDHSFG